MPGSSGTQNPPDYIDHGNHGDGTNATDFLAQWFVYTHGIIIDGRFAGIRIPDIGYSPYSVSVYRQEEKQLN